jgi:hypothetical protein
MDIECDGLVDRRSVPDHRPRRPRAAAVGITSIILHQTGSDNNPHMRTAYPNVGTGTVHQIDRIPAHFVIIHDGTIFYTHDVEYTSGSVGGSRGIDIEFAGSFTRPGQVSAAAICAGRNLVKMLHLVIPSITHIHPHGQVQALLQNGTPCGGSTGVRCGKVDSDPGPEIWLAVGDWAHENLGLVCDQTSGYQNNGISDRQRDNSYRRELAC